MAQGYALGQPYSEGLSSQWVQALAPPGANTNLVFKPDANWIWRLVSLVVTLTTDANVANRYVSVEYLDGSNNAFAVDAASVVTAAGATQRYAGSITRGGSSSVAAGDVLFALTPVFLIPGHTLNVIVGGKQAGDTLTKAMAVFDRFPTGRGDEPYESD